MQERLPHSPPLPEAPPGSAAAAQPVIAGEVVAPAHLADPRVLQVLTTEHWSLLSQRSLAWTETFARAGMFLATLSAATVALALAGSLMGEGFIPFALVILPVVLFVGLATVIRLGQANADDLHAVQGMNRIRHAYLELLPDLAPYFITSRYDDVAGIMVSSGAPEEVAPRIGQPTVAAALGGFFHGLVTTVGVIGVINCVVAGVFVGLGVAALGGDVTAAIAAGVVGFVILLALQTIWGLLTFKRAAERLVVRFPMPRPGA
jgi:hypothetical protein